MLRKFSYLLVLAGLFSFYRVVLAVDYFPGLNKESIVKIEAFSSPGDKDSTQQGTGFFIDYRGCILTAGHILYKNQGVKEQFSLYKVFWSQDIKKEPVFLGSAKVEYLDIGRDVGILCLENPNRQFFHPLELMSFSAYEKIKVGDNLGIAGFPIIGGKTPVFVSSEVIGFWQNPDLVSLLRLDYFETSKMELLKTAALTGPGGSGGPVVDEKEKVLGVVFAASTSPSGVSFLLSSKTIRESLLEKPLAFGCQKEQGTSFYTKENVSFYDADCLIKRNLNTEELIKQNYTARCQKDLGSDNLNMAAFYIESGRSSIDDWWTYLLKLCPLPVAEIQVGVTLKPAEKVLIYGKWIEVDLVLEEKKWQELRKELRKNLTSNYFNSIDKKKSTFLKAYLYGGYDIKSIIQAIKFGGFTVHPNISYASWKNSADFKKYINK